MVMIVAVVFSYRWCVSVLMGMAVIVSTTGVVVVMVMVMMVWLDCGTREGQRTGRGRGGQDVQADSSRSGGCDGLARRGVLVVVGMLVLVVMVVSTTGVVVVVVVSMIVGVSVFISVIVGMIVERGQLADEAPQRDGPDDHQEQQADASEHDPLVEPNRQKQFQFVLCVHRQGHRTDGAADENGEQLLGQIAVQLFLGVKMLMIVRHRSFSRQGLGHQELVGFSLRRSQGKIVPPDVMYHNRQNKGLNQH